MKLQLLAIPLLLALLVSPFFAMAATESVTFTSPAANASLTGTAAYTISGTISPAPTLPDNVAIAVTNPNGQLVDQASEAVQAGGSWTPYSTYAGGNSNWVSGTYKISVSDDTGPIGSTTFTYTSSPSQTTTGALSVTSPSMILPGQTANIFVWVSAPATVTGWYLAPGAATTTSLGTATRVTPNPGGLYVYMFSVTLSSTAASGAYLVGAAASNSTSGFAASNIGSFTVNGGVAQQASLVSDITGLGNNVTSLSSAVAAINSAVGSLSSSVSSLSSTVGSINSAISGLSSTLGSIQTALGTVSTNVQSLGTSLSTLSSTVNTISSSIGSISSSITTLTNDVAGMQSSITGLSGLGSDMSSLQSSVSSLSTSVSNAQTYILVVAALAVITLVLELAILIRKMS